MSNKLLVVIGGPTGVGKTDIAVTLAKHYQTEIISADSRQVYKELNIGVSRPTAEQLSSVRHHLIGYRSIMEQYSAGQYTNDALAVLESLFNTHDIVILTGGTGLYIQSLTGGLDEIPEIPESVTLYWTNYWKEKGTEALVEEVKKTDPEYLQSVDVKNHMRLIRALSVIDHTGLPFSSFRKGKKVSRYFNVLPIILELPRPELYQRIDQRVLEMIEKGWLEEAKSLYPHRHLKALQTVGYKELFEFIDGQKDFPQTIAAIQQSTRRYAKRQMTWWRHQGEWHSFHPEQVNAIIEVIDQVLEA